MRVKTKRGVVAFLAISSAFCLGGALALYGTNHIAASAADGDYLAFVNVGADVDAALADEALGLKTKGAAATTEGTVKEGSTLFTSYSEGAAYSFGELGAGNVNVAVAVIAEDGTKVTVDGTEVAIPAGTAGKYVATKTVAAQTGTPVTVAVEGKLCGVLVTAEGDKTLMTADYTPGQVVSYGALLSGQLENATGYYSDGSTAEMKIAYENVTAGGGIGINTNFTTVDVTGVVEGTELRVTRYVTTMPDELVYFVNCGSETEDGKWIDTKDPYYNYNQTVFDYYGDSLLNDEPDHGLVNKGGDEWGYYKGAPKDAGPTHSSPGDATFPYNTLRFLDKGDGVDFGYMFTDLEPNASYRVWVGTLSHWHARSVKIFFNGEVVDADTLRINLSKGYSVYENVVADANGKIDLFMNGASTNEPCINFIAVQPMSVEIPQISSAVQGAGIVGLEDVSLPLTGVVAGGKLQLFNADKPNQLLYEETVDGEKLGEDGSYLLTWGEPIKNITRFNVVQINKGGVSEPLVVSVTDIQGFKATLPEGYVTDSVSINVQAHADSGIVSWSYQLGEYGLPTVFALDYPYAINENFTVTENGDYVVIITSGLGVTYAETVAVRNIDHNRPVISVTPSADGWGKSGYNATLKVDSVAPVTEYALYKNGVSVATGTQAPKTLSFTEEGEYLVYVKTAAGQSCSYAVRVSENPVTTIVSKSVKNDTLKFSFGESKNYEIAAVTAYQLKETSVSRMTIATGNTMDVYNEGRYVVTVTTVNGTVEMFSIDVTEQDLASTSEEEVKVAGVGENAGGVSASALGVGLGVGIGGVVLAGAAVVVTVFLLKKRKAQ